MGVTPGDFEKPWGLWSPLTFTSQSAQCCSTGQTLNQAAAACQHGITELCPPLDTLDGHSTVLDPSLCSQLAIEELPFSRLCSQSQARSLHITASLYVFVL